MRAQTSRRKAGFPDPSRANGSGKLTESELVAEASAFELTANVLAQYTFDRPVELTELAMIVDARHHGLFAEAISKNRAGVAPLPSTAIMLAVPAAIAA